MYQPALTIQLVIDVIKTVNIQFVTFNFQNCPLTFPSYSPYTDYEQKH